jgi:hypothetical protein
LPDGTIVYHKVFDGGNNEAFVIHVKEVIKLAERKNYFDFYEGAVFRKGQSMTQFNKAQKKFNDAINDPTSTEDKRNVLEKSLELATQVVRLHPCAAVGSIQDREQRLEGHLVPVCHRQVSKRTTMPNYDIEPLGFS